MKSYDIGVAKIDQKVTPVKWIRCYYSSFNQLSGVIFFDYNDNQVLATNIFEYEKAVDTELQPGERIIGFRSRKLNDDLTAV